MSDAALRIGDRRGFVAKTRVGEGVLGNVAESICPADHVSEFIVLGDGGSAERVAMFFGPVGEIPLQ